MTDFPEREENGEESVFSREVKDDLSFERQRRARIDGNLVETACIQLVKGLGYDVSDKGFADTPARMARMLLEISQPLPFDTLVFDKAKHGLELGSHGDQMIIVKDIEFYSLCEHHVIPFFGTVSIGYIPKNLVVGLSKLARCVEFYARRLQIQERITSQVASWVMGTLDPLGVGVIVKARHLCMDQRGVEKGGSETITSAMLGVFYQNVNTRQEFLKLCGL